VGAGSLAGQTAIVTGGGSGIGRGICEAFAGAGASVAVVDVDGERARGVVDEIRATGSAALAVEADVSDPLAVEGVVTQTLEHLGRIDVLVNNAGINAVERFPDVSLETWRHVFAVNVEGVLLMIRSVAAVMSSQDPHTVTGCRGKIINVSSAAADEGRPLFPAYGASKAAVNHLSKTCARVLAESAIATTVIYPGDVADGMWSALPGQIASIEGSTAEAVVSARLAASPTRRFQSARELGEMAVFVAAARGLELNGSLLWTIPHLSPL